MVYADRYDGTAAHPVLDYQAGSLRDDFDFGELLLIRTDLLQKFAQEEHNYKICRPLRSTSILKQTRRLVSFT